MGDLMKKLSVFRKTMIEDPLSRAVSLPGALRDVTVLRR